MIRRLVLLIRLTGRAGLPHTSFNIAISVLKQPFRQIVAIQQGAEFTTVFRFTARLDEDIRSVPPHFVICFSIKGVFIQFYVHTKSDKISAIVAATSDIRLQFL